jgi:uncharacterized protein GlcG (DUF336 family)
MMQLKRKHVAVQSVILALVTGGMALAQGILTEKNISIALAQEAAMTALEKCRADGFRVSVVVLDRGGNIKAVLRDDNAGLHTPDTAQRKAFTSLTFRIPTTTFAQRVQGNPALGTINGVIALGGGLPIQSGTEVVAAIGVGGAPSGDADAVCAQAGIDKIKDRL